MKILVETPFFHVITKIELSSGRDLLKRSPWKLMRSSYFHFLILKSSFLSWSTLRDFCFWKINILEVLKHADFAEIALLFVFGHIWSEDQPDIIRISSWRYQICVQHGPRTIWEQKHWFCIVIYSIFQKRDRRAAEWRRWHARSMINSSKNERRRTANGSPNRP